MENGQIVEHAARVAEQIKSMACVLYQAACDSDGSYSDMAPALDVLFEVAHKHNIEMQELNEKI